jgi:hypothetical protein
MKRLPPSVGTWRSFATKAVFPEDKLAEGANLDRTYLSGIERYGPTTTDTIQEYLHKAAPA